MQTVGRSGRLMVSLRVVHLLNTEGGSMRAQLYVCYYSLKRSRMNGWYLVEAPNARTAAKRVRIVDSRAIVIDKVETYAQYVCQMGWLNLTAEQENDLLNKNCAHIEEGT